MDGSDGDDKEQAEVFLQGRVGDKAVDLCDLLGEEGTRGQEVCAEFHVEDGGRSEGSYHGGFA